MDDPGFVAGVQSALMKRGWQHVHLDGETRGDASFEIELDDRVVQFHLDRRDLVRWQKTAVISLECGLSDRLFDQIADRILPPAKGFHMRQLLATHRFETAWTGRSGIDISSVVTCASQHVDWATAQDIEAVIRPLAKPWETHGQLRHLAALAYLADHCTLQDYVTVFERGQRAAFHPHIGADAVQRAWDIALERL